MDPPVELEVYAVRVYLSFDPPIFERGCRDLAARLLEDVSRRCLESGGRLIGHVKCFAETSGANCFYCNLTSLAKGATCEGPLRTPGGAGPGASSELSSRDSASCDSMAVALNVLIYGIPWHVTDGVVVQVLRDLASDVPFRFEIEYPTHSH